MGRVKTWLATVLVLFATGLVILLTQTACDLGDTGPPSPPSQGTIGSSRLLVAKRDFVQSSPVPKGMAIAAGEFSRAGVTIIQVPIRQADRPPLLPAYFHDHQSTCTEFYLNQDLADQNCGTRNELAMYAYYYRSALPHSYGTLNDILFYVTPLHTIVGKFTVGVTTLASESDPAESTDYYEGSFVFENAIDDAMHDWNYNVNTRVNVDWRLFGASATHELGLQIGHLNEMDYTQFSPDNIYHNGTFSPKCVMTTKLEQADVVQDSTLHFCKDTFPDAVDTNSCYDNLRKRFGL